MHYYNMQSDQISEMHARIKELEKELEEVNASSELMFAAAWDEIDESRERERRMLWTAMVFATVAMLAIWVACWKDGGW